MACDSFTMIKCWRSKAATVWSKSTKLLSIPRMFSLCGWSSVFPVYNWCHWNVRVSKHLDYLTEILFPRPRSKSKNASLHNIGFSFAELELGAWICLCLKRWIAARVFCSLTWSKPEGGTFSIKCAYLVLQSFCTRKYKCCYFICFYFFTFSYLC